MRKGTDTERTGFTLLELLVAITLIGIVMMIAVPRVASTTMAHEVMEEARLVHERLAMARTQAIAEQTDYRVSVSGGQTLAVDRWDGAAWTSVYVSDPLAADLEVDGSADGSIVMQARGMVAAPRTFRLERDGHEAIVRVLASGLVQWGAAP